MFTQNESASFPLFAHCFLFSDRTTPAIGLDQNQRGTVIIL